MTPWGGTSSSALPPTSRPGSSEHLRAADLRVRRPFCMRTSIRATSRRRTTASAHEPPLARIPFPDRSSRARCTGTAPTLPSLLKGRDQGGRHCTVLLDDMSATLLNHPLPNRLRPPCEPMRYRATITIDFTAADEFEANDEKAAIEAAFAAIQRVHECAQLDFRRRRPRARPRPGAPGVVIVAYADD